MGQVLDVGGDGQVVQGLLKLGHNVLDEEDTHQGTEDLLGRPVSGGVPAIAL